MAAGYASRRPETEPVITKPRSRAYRSNGSAPGTGGNTHPEIAQRAPKIYGPDVIALTAFNDVGKIVALRAVLLSIRREFALADMPRSTIAHLVEFRFEIPRTITAFRFALD